ncbi:MAG: GNAT family N-acetyltransferase [Lachnospiraceae bacterium]|nr:GNAT family N-acetyltransferase [Lachnospiraceae bacterium]
MQLAWDTFMIYESPDYSLEGVQHFHAFVKDETLKKMFLKGEYQVWGAFENHIMVGIVSIRNHGHISLLFVDTDHQHRGIATALLQNLFSYAKNEMNVHEITVNAAPYAVDFYHRIGFIDLSREKTTDGIRYTPMIIHI